MLFCTANIHRRKVDTKLEINHLQKGMLLVKGSKHSCSICYYIVTPYFYMNNLTIQCSCRARIFSGMRFLFANHTLHSLYIMGNN
jgi:hypothetical protein